MSKNLENEITKKGNPSHPRGAEGLQMLTRMNQSHEEVTNWGLSHLAIKHPKRLLDIGCGGGATLARLLDKYPKAQVLGVDASSLSVKTSKEYNKDSIYKGEISVLKASVEKLPFDDNQMDGIVTVESFYFWSNPIENLKEVFRVLKTGGQFLIIADIYDNGQLSKEALENIAEFQLHNPTKEQFFDYFQQAGFSYFTFHTKAETSWACVEGWKA